MFKTDASGIILWSQTYGGLYDDVGESGIETSTGDFIATGIERVDNWQGNVFIAKYSSTGSTVWIKNYTCTQSELGMRILEAADGGYAVAGTLYDTLGAPQDIFIFKTDSAGNLLWNKTYGGAGEEAAFGFCLSPDGGYVVSGTSTSFGSGDKDAYLLKVDADGNQQWSRNYGGLKDDGIYTVAATGDGFITAGATFSFTDSIDMLIIKTDIYGNQLWMKTIGTPGYISGANWLTICDDEGIAIVGNKQPIGSDNGQMLFIKTDSHGDIENIQSPNLTSSSFDVYPVPVTTDLNLAYDNSIINPEIRIFNSMGSLVIETTGQKKINTSALSSGLYYVTLTKDEQLLSQKFIKR
jgi:hypothetical protein